ncbi:hypothetical protein JK361_33865 [Streptomyces sp. 5-8]|uniref:Mobile element transfer n=1 Tax=Streptomyces musisoli TaxID=2802280 RepID=A0ABS1PC93_9ACTN|nr:MULTISPECIES: hypothetical protein [Streptomyces]MBL1109511.1 hypothetical protein [Streptomyces musisoli]MBY8843424.1 hypothetical protein [Streptomyces sp. SP2-10]
MAFTSAQQGGPEQVRPGQEHLTTTTEQGRFCVARCSCGWRGPARRARSQARTDAEGHAAGR